MFSNKTLQRHSTLGTLGTLRTLGTLGTLDTLRTLGTLGTLHNLPVDTEQWRFSPGVELLLVQLQFCLFNFSHSVIN